MHINQNKVSKLPEVPRGTITLKVFKDKVPTATMSGTIVPNDLRYAVIALRRGFHRYMDELGRANIKKQEEALRVRIEAEKREARKKEENK